MLVVFRSLVSEVVCAPWRLVGGGPTAGHFFLLRQEKVTKKKATADAAALRVPKFSSRQPGLRTNSLRSNMSSALSVWRLENLAASYDGVRQLPLQKQLQRWLRRQRQKQRQRWLRLQGQESQLL